MPKRSKKERLIDPSEATKFRKAIGRRFRKKRDAERLTQDEFAELTGMSQSSISKLEAGSRKIDVAELIQICDFLELSDRQIRYVIFGSGKDRY